MSYQNRILELRKEAELLKKEIKQIAERPNCHIYSEDLSTFDKISILIDRAVETANDAQREIVLDLDKHVKAGFADIGKEFTKFKYTFKSISVHDLGRVFQRAASSQKTIAEGLHLTL